MLNIYITNLGKYNEGELIGEWVSLPIDEEELDEVYNRIGINEFYEETFITDYETDFMLEVNEYESIETLNEYAEQTEDLLDYERHILAALVENGYEFSEAIERIDDCIVYDNCFGMGDVAYRMYQDGLFGDRIPESIENYIDWDALGRDLEYEGNWIYCNGGYIEVLF